MNRERAIQVANAVLYEGYMLYPYRRSALKNRQRWSFGILYPPAYREVAGGTERSTMHSECLVKSNGDAAVHVELRFLHLVTVAAPPLNSPDEPDPEDEQRESWDEGVERSVQIDYLPRTGSAESVSFSVGGSFATESVRDAGQLAKTVTQTQHEITGTVSLASQPVGDNLWKLTIEVANTTVLSSEGDGDADNRDAALLRSLLSAHTILSVNSGEFVSLLDPPAEFKAAASACRNMGNFPVLLGDEQTHEHDMLLCSPILLYDYPQIAPESNGDFFDSTEMDEMLTLRVMTLSDQEKSEMRAGDSRLRQLLERTEQNAREQLMRTHGTFRGLRPLSEDRMEWNELQDNKRIETVTVFGVTVKPGDRVRLWPQKTADIMDMALKGKVAVVEAIESDFEDRVHLAVVLEDDPGRDLGMLRQPGHRFFFSPDEVEPVALNGEAAHER